jgi:Rhodopirellula transposase DDE domain
MAFVCGQRRQQQWPEPDLEALPPTTLRPIGHRLGSLSLSFGDTQVGPGGASLVFVHQLELGWRTPGGYETVVNLIGSTRTQKGPRVKTKLNKKHYETGKKISDEEMDELNTKYDKVNPQWNFTICPQTQEKKVKK